MTSKMLLPRDVIEHIASFADIDTRRALGIKPNKLDQQFIEQMNKMINKKYATQCKEYSYIISTVCFIDKKKLLYITYNTDNDIKSFTFYEGRVQVVKYRILDTLKGTFTYRPYAIMDSTDIIRGDATIVDKNGLIQTYKSIGLATRITEYTDGLFIHFRYLQ